jgi:SAM-dependent methyltransferase
MNIKMNFYNSSFHRQLLEKEIIAYSDLVAGKVLDIGSKNRRYDYLFKNADNITAIDIKPHSGFGVMPADIINLPFADGCFDTVVSFEVLEYITDTKMALSEIGRVLKKDGLLIFSVPFLDPVHGDIDSVRYTFEAWEELLKDDFKIEKSIVLGGRYSLIWDLFFERVRNNFRTLCRLVLIPALAILKKMSVYFDNKEKNRRFAMGYFFICKKKE